LRIKDKVIILTGAARIGLDVAKALQQHGVKLAVTYMSTQPDLGSEVLYIKADLTLEEDVKKVVDETTQRFGQVDALVHMAANYPRAKWDELNNETWNQAMRPIARTSFLMGKAVGDVLLRNPGEIKGKMIFFSDWSVTEQPYKDYLPYNVAKSAVEGLTRSFAKELAPGITVNCIAPGPILKPADLSDEENAEVMKNTPLERWGGAEEITKAVLYLLDSDFVTGQILVVDGGRSIA
jgi:NAD(P)-dependent dehydrogenase (short-subunit alcohol dehydrogenase family)